MNIYDIINASNEEVTTNDEGVFQGGVTLLTF